ncbi:PilZ domain-containing protein [Methylobacterium sp. NFXW15]|uniref:PilZ domain-containing protein n=1 Tax=Methylobacterium sp. NFXW15 TaxID=2819512 RepID=UPI003CF4349B
MKLSPVDLAVARAVNLETCSKQAYLMSRNNLIPSRVERRGNDGTRSPVTLLASIQLANGEKLPCVIRDLSSTGAKLAVSRRYELPTEFNLFVRGRETQFPVRRMWQRGDHVGVKLIISMDDQLP